VPDAIKATEVDGDQPAFANRIGRRDGSLQDARERIEQASGPVDLVTAAS
jgi:hypothetical protein